MDTQPWDYWEADKRTPKGNIGKAIALKFGAWWLTNSVGLLSDALESLVNLAGAMFALTMVTLAAQPPDEDHPYGHHKYESFASAAIGLMLCFAAFCMAASSIYVLNDLVDIKADRAHPKKRHRPIASGRVWVSPGILETKVMMAPNSPSCTDTSPASRTGRSTPAAAP